MSKKTIRYTPEFKQQMVAMLHSGRTAASLSKEFGPTAWSISLWDKQAGRDARKGDGGLPGSPPRTFPRSALRVRPSEPGHPLGGDDVPIVADLEKRILCLE
jgi:transposase-like protein